MNDNDYQAWAEMGLREEHENWLNDPVAQAEYKLWLDQRNVPKIDDDPLRETF